MGDDAARERERILEEERQRNADKADKVERERDKGSRP